MSDMDKLSLTVLHCVAEFLALLPEDQLRNLAEGTARLTIIPKDSAEPLLLTTSARPAGRRGGASAPRATAKPKVDMSETKERLESVASREDARQLLTSFNKEPHLTSLAALLGMSGVSSLRKADLIEMIVEFTVGNRLNSGAIRQL
jgi:hypothetical protein